MDSSRADRFRTSLLTWGEDNIREFPWREPHRSLYEVFVAEFFLTQTPADNVSSVYPLFLDRFPSLTTIRDAERAELVNIIEPLGFYNIRADALQNIADEFDALPRDADQLSNLHRVGDYVANATICFTHNEPLPILDRNVERIYDRLFGDEWPDTPTDKLQFAQRLVPEEAARTYNLALLDFGALVCRPEPLCEQCFATEYCAFYDSSTSPNESSP